MREFEAKILISEQAAVCVDMSMRECVCMCECMCVLGIRMCVVFGISDTTCVFEGGKCRNEVTEDEKHFITQKYETNFSTVAYFIRSRIKTAITLCLIDLWMSDVQLSA